MMSSLFSFLCKQSTDSFGSLCTLVKPAAIETVHLEASPDRRLQVQWDLPNERIPRHCLEYEVEAREEGVGGQLLLVCPSLIFN